MNASIPRNIFVCISHECRVCRQDIREVPDECSYRILHPLDIRRGGYQERKRRTGKTIELVEMANELDEAGYIVYYIAETESMAEHTRRVHRLNPSVKLMSWRRAQNYMRGMAPGVILADDITVSQMDEARRDFGGMGHNFLAHYWTPRA